MRRNASWGCRSLVRAARLPGPPCGSSGVSRTWRADRARQPVPALPLGRAPVPARAPGQGSVSVPGSPSVPEPFAPEREASRQAGGPVPSSERAQSSGVLSAPRYRRPSYRQPAFRAPRSCPYQFRCRSSSFQSRRSPSPDRRGRPRRRHARARRRQASLRGASLQESRKRFSWKSVLQFL